MNIEQRISIILIEQSFEVPMIEKYKFKKLNLKTNRMKTSRKTRLLVTDIEPNNRNFKNLPRYANDKPKVRFQDWLLIKGEKRNPKHSVNSFGKSEADSKTWYGWSHRAIYGFKPGDTVKVDTIGNDTGKEYIIKNDDQARQTAINFAEGVS